MGTISRMAKGANLFVGILLLPVIILGAVVIYLGIKLFSRNRKDVTIEDII